MVTEILRDGRMDRRTDIILLCILDTSDLNVCNKTISLISDRMSVGSSGGYDRLDFSRAHSELRPEYHSTHTLKSHR